MHIAYEYSSKKRDLDERAIKDSHIYIFYIKSHIFLFNGVYNWQQYEKFVNSTIVTIFMQRFLSTMDKNDTSKHRYPWAIGPFTQIWQALSFLSVISSCDRDWDTMICSSKLKK